MPRLRFNLDTTSIMSHSGNDDHVSEESGSSPGNASREKKYPEKYHSKNPNPRPQQQYRNQQRPYVEDLRVKLNRKRQEKGQEEVRKPHSFIE